MAAPIGYLVPVAFISLCVYFVLAPRRWPQPLRVVGQYLVVVNELPFIALTWLISVNVLTASEGGISSPLGWTAFGVAILAGLGLLLIIFQSLRAKRVIVEALATGLGKGWSSSIDRKLSARLSSRPVTLRAMLGPLFIRRSSVKHLRNLSYGDAGWFNTLDVYHRKNPAQNAPIFIHIHGGALVSGRKDHDARPLLYQLASHGWVCISANYRLSPAASFEEQVSDVKRVIVWAKTHAAEYGGDSTAVFLAGGSSGAQLAAVAALTPHDPALQPGFERADTTVSAVISLYGNYTYGTADTLPSTHIRRDAPPFFVLHGGRDTTLPATGSRIFAEKLKKVSSSPVVYAELPGAEHNFDQFNSIRSRIVANAVEAFAAWVRLR